VREVLLFRERLAATAASEKRPGSSAIFPRCPSRSPWRSPTRFTSTPLWKCRDRGSPVVFTLWVT
jgi:hypothetical protein